MSKNFKRTLSITLFLIPIIVCVYFRSYSITLPAAGEIAKKKIHEEFRSDLKKKLDVVRPDLPQKTKERLIGDEFKKKDVQERLNEEISAQAAIIKARYTAESGQTYLLELDPYHWMRLLENLLKNGHIGDSIKDGEPWDDYMLAPFGMASSKTLHIWLGYFLHRIHIPFFFLPIFLSAFSIAIAYVVIRRSWGEVAAFFGAFMLSIFPFYLRRTMAGFSDTDAYNVLFPFLVIGLLLEAYRLRRYLVRLLFAVIAGAATGLYALFWGGWWYTFDLALIAILCYILDSVQRKDKAAQEMGILFVYFSACALFVCAASGLRDFMEFVSAPFEYASYGRLVMPGGWPNIFASVGELAKVNFRQVILDSGGFALFLVPLVGILASTIKRGHNQEPQRKFLNFLLILWFAVTLQLTFKAVRFLLLLVPAYCIAFGMGVVLIRDYGLKVFSLLVGAIHELPLHRDLTRWQSHAVIALVLAIFFANRLVCAHSTAMDSHLPLMTDEYMEGLMKLKNETSPDAIITSSWDYGHWIKYAAKRRVLFDGMTQNTPVAYWVYKAFLSEGEKESLATLRMLYCGFNAQCIPPEGYLLIDPHMVNTASVWAHYGAWDFKRSKEYLKGETSNIRGDGEADMWIAPRPKFISVSTKYKTIDDTLVFDNGFVYEKRKNIAWVKRNNQTGIPKGLIYLKDRELIEEEFPDADLPYYAILTKTGENYRAVLVEPPLHKSLFTKLYFLRGFGLKHFKPFWKKSTPDGGEILIYKIIWSPSP